MQPTAADRAYDVERMVKRIHRLRLAREQRITPHVLEDYLASMQPSAFDRRIARYRLAESRERLGW